MKRDDIVKMKYSVCFQEISSISSNCRGPYAEKGDSVCSLVGEEIRIRHDGGGSRDVIFRCRYLTLPDERPEKGSGGRKH